jgi:hypothetical protein
MADIFGRNQPVGGVLLSDQAIMTIAGAGSLGVGALVQNVELNYQQQVNSLFELGSNRIYQAMGRPVGQMTIGRIVGSSEWMAELFNSCSGGGTVSFSGTSGGCFGVTGQFSRTAVGVFVTNYGFSMNTQELMIRENLQAQFSGLN